MLRLTDTGYAAWDDGQSDRSFLGGGFDGEVFAVMTTRTHGP